MGTLLVNVFGCLLIGFLAVMAENSRLISVETRNFLIVGILGPLPLFQLWLRVGHTLKNGLNLHFALNIGLQLVLGFLAVWGGMSWRKFSSPKHNDS